MKKMSALFAAVLVLMFAALPPAYSGPETSQTCPVTGDAIKSDKFAAEYQGKIYHFCCKGCVRKFTKDPARYLSEAQPA